MEQIQASNLFDIRTTRDVENLIKEHDLRFFSDGSHGWLRAPRDLIKQLGVKEKISGYSYMNDQYVYLEEDCDIMAVLSAIPESGRKAFMALVPETYHHQSPVRNFPHYDAAKF